MSAAAARRRDHGFTMIELLVGMVLLGVIGALLLGSVLGAQKVVQDTQDNTDLIGDTRLAVERLVRELRQAGTIDAVALPATPGEPTAITFWADFDNDGARDLDAADPEVLTYRYTPATAQLTLTVDDATGTAVTTPILAGNVAGFELQLRSSQWPYDADADGIVDWSELDAAGPPVGNENDVPDGPELARIDSIALRLDVQDGPRNQSYVTQIDFRNRHQS